MARTNRPDEAYHIPTLNVWFAASAFVLLITSVWMVWADYNREWKQTQRDFRDMERARLHIEEQQKVAETSEEDLAKLQAAVQKTQQELLGKKAELDAQLKKVDALEQDIYYTAKQNYQFALAALGDMRYKVDEKRAHYGDDSPLVKAAMKQFTCEEYRIEGGASAPQGCAALPNGKSLRALFLDTEDELLAAKAGLDSLKAAQKAAETALTAAKGEVTKVQKRLATIKEGFFNDNFRDAPLLDFLVPSLKIRQAVISEIRDDYNFATVQKEDRCMTCHQGVDQPVWVVQAESGRFSDTATRKALEADVIAALRSYVATSAPVDEREGIAEEIETFVDDAAVTWDAWFDENLDTETHLPAFRTAAAEPLEALRLRTQTYKAHPNLDLYMTSASPHPMGKIGCTVCHEGRGHATEFNRVFHTPKNPEQEAQWHDDYGWHEPHYWDYPQLPADRVTASCAKCHDAEIKLTGGDAYVEGRRLVERVGCYGCHRIEGMDDLRRAGPSLVRLPHKVDREFSYSWIWDPKHFRPSSRMPRFFDQTNNSLPKFKNRNQQEVRGILSYLYANSEGYEMVEPPRLTANLDRGKQVFREVGCLGCHGLESDGLTAENHGPDLSGIGSKLSNKWLYNWIRNPRRYFSKTHMPSLRLTDQEAVDVSAYLTSLKKEGWKPIATPDRDVALQEALLRQSLSTSMRRAEINKLLTSLSPDEREVLLGEKSIAKYGCFGCHDIKGFENAGPIGTELSLWGDKFITQLDFGLISHHGPDREVDYSHIAWATNKLKNPRFWDRGKEATKPFKDLLKMPNFGFTEQEIHSVVTFLMSRRKQYVDHANRPAETPEYVATQMGRRIVRNYNCHGCHYFDSKGGGFAQYWSVNSAGQAEFGSGKIKPDFSYLEHVPGPVRGHVPPVLLDQGNKTKPEWLFGFLLEPTPLRPQLKMRMPTFQLTDEETNKLIQMFAGIEGHSVGDHSSYQPDPQLAVIGQELFNRGKCTRCHMFTDTDPNTVPEGVVAPNLKLTAHRLQRSWTPRWLEDPQSIMPGANMPNYFDMESNFTALDMDGSLLDGDLKKGMQAIGDYLIISGQTYRGAARAQR